MHTFTRTPSRISWRWQGMNEGKKTFKFILKVCIFASCDLFNVQPIPDKITAFHLHSIWISASVACDTVTISGINIRENENENQKINSDKTNAVRQINAIIAYDFSSLMHKGSQWGEINGQCSSRRTTRAIRILNFLISGYSFRCQRERNLNFLVRWANKIHFNWSKLLVLLVK